MYFLIAFGLSFAIYLLTLAPTVYNLDSAELTTAAATLGLTRSTGYPLYLSIGHIWSKIPLGDVGYRMNILSAFSGALTIGILAVILKDHLHVKGWAIFGALGLFATGKIFWAMSSIAEVYTFQTALMAGLILSLLRWQENPTSFRMGLVGFALGLSLCHHAASILMLPGVFIIIITVLPHLESKYKILGAGAIGLLLGMAPLLYLPIRYYALPVFNYAGYYDGGGVFHPVALDTFRGLWTLISGKSFTGVMFAYTNRAAIHESILFLGSLWRAFLIIGIGPAIVGGLLLFKRNRPAGVALGLMFVFHAIFFINYRVIDKEVMFLPCYLIWALWLGIGYQWLEDMIRRGEMHQPQKSRISISSIAVWSLRGLIAGLVVLSFVWKINLVDQSDNWSTRQLGEKILEQLEPNSLIFGYWDTVPIIEYLTLVEGLRPDVQPVNRFLISDHNMLVWINREISNRPIYITSQQNDFPDNIESIELDGIYQLVKISP
jgi:hypothetical protein